MEKALEQWRQMLDGIPNGDSVCHLIESIEGDEDEICGSREMRRIIK